MMLISIPEWKDPIVQKTAALLDGQRSLEENMDIVEVLHKTGCLSVETLCATMFYVPGWEEARSIVERKDSFPLQVRHLIDAVYEGTAYDERAYYKSPLDAPLMVFLADKICAMEANDLGENEPEEDDDENDEDDVADPDDDDIEPKEKLADNFNKEALPELTEEELEMVKQERMAEVCRAVCQDMREVCIGLGLTNRLTQLPPALSRAFFSALDELIERMPDPEHKRDLALSMAFVHKAMGADLSPRIARHAPPKRFSPN